MRVFVTGATGFIGSAVVKELIEAGHDVTGLARSESSARKLAEMGAHVRHGSIEDLASLRRGAQDADAAIHLAFYHDISHMPWSTRLRVLMGGSPKGIAPRFFSEAVRTDRNAIRTLGESLTTHGGALVAAFGTLAMRPSHLAKEDESHDPASLGSMRANSEHILTEFASRSIRTSVVRLPPVVHGAGDGGFATRLIQIARKRGKSVYIEAGSNRWPSVHRTDAARLFRLALERGRAGATYHAVAEEGVRFRDIAELIGGRLNVPVVSKSAADAAKQFGFLAPFVSIDNPVSSSMTQVRLLWKPTQPGLLADLDQAYF